MLNNLQLNEFLDIIYIKNNWIFMIEPNNSARLTMENGFLVLTKAFKKGGVFHDIVISDGDRQFQRGDHLDHDLKEKIQRAYVGCLIGNQIAQNSDRADGYFVYTKDPTTLGMGETQTQVISAQFQKPFNIGKIQPQQRGPVVDDLMQELSVSLGIFKEYNINVQKPNEPPVLATAPPQAGTGAAPQPAAANPQPVANPPVNKKAVSQSKNPDQPKAQPNPPDSPRARPRPEKEIPLANAQARQQQLANAQARQQQLEAEQRRRAAAASLAGQAKEVLGPGFDGHRLARAAAQHGPQPPSINPELPFHLAR